MKSLFKDLQKSHMKQLKAEGEGAAARPHSKGFVKDSLVMVEVEEMWDEPHRVKLKVCVVDYPYKICLVHIKLTSKGVFSAWRGPYRSFRS